MIPFFHNENVIVKYKTICFIDYWFFQYIDCVILLECFVAHILLFLQNMSSREILDSKGEERGKTTQRGFGDIWPL